ncbi:TIGR04282 family arsenosugar biosynthesis glycosyltransferase [Opitutia bacterium ISCC 51]|nr:TIGR04282 family arsenosugar biosynthesis glycosyltransferase [Opitutae bacterium ISCC 51]QXD27944.1 TIGR04282 family arsenosugar biosynthesis glycosyltransferase [Opitutae bacterium ISCC 52]
MNVVSLFLKAPTLGAVKTRLAKSIGDEGALIIYCELVEFLLKRIPEANVHVHYTPDALSEMEGWLGPNYLYHLQEGEGLGDRLTRSMQWEFRTGCDKLIFLGGDCPFVDQERLDEAFAALDTNDVVIGPAMDGGYYLIGIKQSRPELFAGVDWGTESVCETTLSICEREGLSVALLKEESDVDDLESWQKAKRFIRGND